MTKKGFTLVELLAVIVLMAILITVAVPGITRIGRSLKVQSFCSKIKIIESAALEYANDYYSGKEVAGSKVSLDNVSLMDLVNMGYLKGDNDLKSASNLTDKEKEDKGFYLMVADHFIVVYEQDKKTLYMTTDILLENLKEDLQAEIMKGKYIESEEELYHFLESYSS